MKNKCVTVAKAKSDDTQTPSYLQEVFTLLKPINAKSKAIETVTVKPITLEQNVELDLPEGDFELTDQVNLIMNSTGLTESEVYQLSKPDYNSIFTSAYAYLTLDAYALSGETRDSKMELDLLFTRPRNVQFEYPDLNLSKQSNQFDDDVDRAVFIMANITDLEEDEIRAMPMPDYRSMLSMTTDFLTKPADYFR